MVGFEALVRWHHPNRGLLSAGQFIDIAIDNNLEVPIGWSVMRETIDQIAVWLNDPAVLHPVATNVNVSARQLRDPEFEAAVREYLRAAGVPPELLCIEVTEQSIIADVNAAIEALSGLRSIGVKVALDDFGTGNSSLSYIRSLPIDTVKLDMSFIEAINDGPEVAAIVAAVIRMSKALGHTVVAEGIESLDQVGTLQALRCDRGQGFLFADALTGEQATDLLTGARLLDSQAARA